jgi:hypothetical protein
VRPAAPPHGGDRGPLVRLRGDPGTQPHPCAGAHWLRPTRSAFRRPPGLGRDGAPEPVSRTGAPPSLSLLSRGPSPHSRTVPPGEPAGRTMLPLLGFRALRHMTGRWTRVSSTDGGSRSPAPRAASGVSSPPSRRPPPPLPTRRARRSVHGLPSSRPSPRTDGCSSRSPCPRAVAASSSPPPMGSGETRPATGPRSRCELVLHTPLRTRAPMPS